MLGAWIEKQLDEKRLAPLRAMTVPELRALWDNVGDDSFSSGFDIADIHLVMNEKGDGAYCAV